MGKAKGHTFDRSKKYKENPNKNPAPGQYEIKPFTSSITRRISMGQRLPEYVPRITPGAGEYDT